MSSARLIHIPAFASKMPSDWQWSRLDEVCDGVIDCPHSTPEISSSGPLMVRSQDIRSGVFRAEQAASVSEETYQERIARATPSFGDLVYSREGTYFGIAAELPKDTRVCLGQRMVLIRPDKDRLNYRFLRFWLNSPMMSDHIFGFRDGTVAERLNMSTIRALPVPLPPLPEQRTIAHILGTLDDKIELNRQMNQTLEGIARALFQSWFIDFEPVWAKVEGRPSGLAPAIEALFPNRFVDTEMGPVPEGWRVGTVGDVADNLRRTVQPNEVDADVPYIGLQHMPQRNVALAEWGRAEEVSSGKYRFVTGEILFGKLRPYFHKVGVAPLDGVCSTDILVIAPKQEDWFGFVLGHLSSDKFVDYTTAVSTGTRMPRTDWQSMARYPVVLPSMDTAKAYTDIVEPLVKRIHSIIFESQSLNELRDTLLPKLISGELRVQRF